MSGPLPDIFVDSKSIGPTDSHLACVVEANPLQKLGKMGAFATGLVISWENVWAKKSFHLSFRKKLVALFRPFFWIVEPRRLALSQNAQTGDRTEAPAEAVARAAASSVRRGLGSRRLKKVRSTDKREGPETGICPDEFIMNYHQSIQPISSLVHTRSPISVGDFSTWKFRVPKEIGPWKACYNRRQQRVKMPPRLVHRWSFVDSTSTGPLRPRYKLCGSMKSTVRIFAVPWSLVCQIYVYSV